MNEPDHEPVADIAADPDAELVRRAVHSPEGDLRAFEQLIVRHQGRLVANCRHITRDANNAEDLAQEVAVKAFFGLRKFEGKSTFRHWLQRIKINHCLNHLKKQEGRSFVDIDDEETGTVEELQVAPIAEKRAEQMNDRKLISEILDSMSETLRVPLILCDMDELSYDEVAQTLNISLSAAKMRIKRAREEFRSRYQAAMSLTA
jgi:RNA polymerase sigma-70 factor, ECF subfamily